jgi:hypothetical protein
MTNGIDRDALTREMKDWTAVSGGTTISISNAVWIAMRHIQAARAEGYKAGWNDREADFMERASSMGLEGK